MSLKIEVVIEEPFAEMPVRLSRSRLKSLKDNNAFIEALKVNSVERDLFMKERTCVPWILQNKECLNAILSPVENVDEEDFVLFGYGSTMTFGGMVPNGKEIYSFFDKEGYEIIQDPHPNLLIDLMSKFTIKELIHDVGVKHYSCVVLPTKEELMVPDEKNKKGFFAMLLYNEPKICVLNNEPNPVHESYGVGPFYYTWGQNTLFLLKKKKAK